MFTYRHKKNLKANVKKRTQQYEKMTSKNNSVHNKIPLKMEVLPGHNTSCIFKGYTVKPVLRGHLWEKDKVAL
jgi:hypothetical protein